MKRLSCCLLFATLAAAQTRYVITDLGANVEASGINAVGQASGTLLIVNHAARWSGGVLTDLGLAGGIRSYGLGINSSGQVVGYTVLSQSTTRGVRWTGTTPELLSPISGACCSYGNAINGSGQVAGISYLASGQIHAASWAFTTPVDLGVLGGISSHANGVNDAGQVAGDSSTSSSTAHAVRWTGTTPADLGTLAGGTTSYGMAINLSGQVAGYSDSAAGPRFRAVRWTGTTPLDLGELLPGGSTVGLAINTAGQVVGSSNGRAFLWDGSPMLDLNNLLIEGDGWLLTEARGINDAGQIVVNGTLLGQPHAAILTPTPGADLTFRTTAAGSPVGLSLAINGVSVTAPITRAFATGTPVTAFAFGPQSLTAGTRYLFHQWSNGGSDLQTIIVPSTPTTYTADFTTQHLLTTQVSPSGSGSVSPASGYQDAGIVPVQASPSGCYGFLNWTGAPVNAGALNLAAPVTLQANFVQNQQIASGMGSLVTLRGPQVLFRRTVSATNTLPYPAAVSFVLDNYSPSTTLVNPAVPSGQTTNCSSGFGTGLVGRSYYTVPNVPPGGVASRSFDFSAPGATYVNFQVTAVAGLGPR